MNPTQANPATAQAESSESINSRHQRRMHHANEGMMAQAGIAW